MDRPQGSGLRGIRRAGALLCLLGAVAAASTAALVSLLHTLSWAELTSPAAEPERLLARLLLLGTLSLVLWWSCGGALLAMRSLRAPETRSPRHGLPHPHLPRAFALPRPVHRIMLLALGINAALLPTAHAQPSDASPSTSPQPSEAGQTPVETASTETTGIEVPAPSGSAEPTPRTPAHTPASPRFEVPDAQLSPLFPETAAILPAALAERLAAPSGLSPAAVREPAELTPLFGAGGNSTGASTDPPQQGRQIPMDAESPAADALHAPGSGEAGAGSSWVVLRGHTLWQIAASCTGDQDDARTARAVQRIYAANEHILRDGPDLLLPGMVLVIPPEAAD